MNLATQFTPNRFDAVNDSDPREEASAEVIDLASRMAYPLVSQRKGRSDALGLGVGAVVVVALGAATLWGLNTSRTADAAARQEPVTTTFGPVASISPVTEGQPAAISMGPVPIQADPSPSAVLAAPPRIQPIPTGNNPYASPTVVFDAGALPSSVAGGSPLETQIPPPPGRENATSDFASRIGGVGGGPVSAGGNFDPATTVTQGTMIAAVLETAIDTDVPGFARAVVSQDVRSFDGRHILVPRSSRLIGQYQSGLQQGQKRAYVIWTRLIRPDGISVALASPATGFDGSGGLPGKVNNHFFERFGSAMLLSVLGGLSAVATGGASVVLGGGPNAASTALQQNGQIAPTVRVRMGEPIRVFTARDLDFSQAPRV